MAAITSSISIATGAATIQLSRRNSRLLLGPIYAGVPYRGGHAKSFLPDEVLRLMYDMSASLLVSRLPTSFSTISRHRPRNSRLRHGVIWE